MVVINVCVGHTNLNNYFKLKKVFVFTKETENRSIKWSVACWSLQAGISRSKLHHWSMNKGRATSASALISMRSSISDDTQRLKPRLFSTSGDSCSQQRRIHPSALVWKLIITRADIGSLNTRCSPDRLRIMQRHARARCSHTHTHDIMSRRRSESERPAPAVRAHAAGGGKPQ